MTDDGIWRITDYKTGKVPASRYVERALAGLFTYAAALAASHPERRIPDEVELLYLLAPARIRRPILRPYLLDHARALGETWTQIQQAHARSRWSVSPGPLCRCPRPARPLRLHGQGPAGQLRRAGRAPRWADRAKLRSRPEAAQQSWKYSLLS